MPKFLDIPYYYGKEGNLLNLDLGEEEIQLVGGTTNISFSNYEYGRYRLKAPLGGGSSTHVVEFSFGTFNASLSVTDAMRECLEFVSFEVMPLLYSQAPSGFYQVVIKNVKISSMENSSNFWSTMLTGDCTLAMCLGESVGFQFSRTDSTIAAPTYNKVGATKAINASLEQNLSSSIYAPVTPGSAGQMLFSGGTSNVPVWQTINLNGVPLSTKSGFYAPESYGASGLFLKANGSGIPPSWAEILPFEFFRKNSISFTEFGSRGFGIFTPSYSNSGTISYGTINNVKMIIATWSTTVQFPDIYAIGITDGGVVKYYEHTGTDMTIIGDNSKQVDGFVVSYDV